MKKLAVLISLLTLTMATFSQISDFGFRNARWGVSPDQVKKTESGVKWQESESDYGPVLYFETEIALLEARALFYFVKNSFEKGTYLITEEHADVRQYLIDHNTLKEILSKKYGKPSEEKEIWLNDLYKNDRQKWGIAISKGHLILTSTWEEAVDTQGIVKLTLTGDNNNVDLNIQYESPGYAKATDALKKKIQYDVF